MKELKEFLAKKSRGMPPILFAKLWGSRSHGTELPESDWDFSGVYIAPTKQVLSFKGIPDSINGKKIEKDDPDYEFHEVGKFCTLLMKGNPGIVEMLFTDRFYVETPEWEWIRGLRNKFLSKQVVLQYLGYASGQLDKLKDDKSLHSKGGKYNEKWAYHMIRVLQDALRICRGAEPLVWKENGERDFLMKIRHGEYSQEEVTRTANNIRAEIEYAKPWSALPDIGDDKALEDWLVSVRLRHL